MICSFEITSEKSKWKKDFPCTHRHRSAVALEEAASSGWSIWARKGRKRIKTHGDKTAIYMDVCMFLLRGFIKHHPAKSFCLILWIFHAAFPLNSGSWGSFDLFLKWLYACASLWTHQTTWWILQHLHLRCNQQSHLKGLLGSRCRAHKRPDMWRNIALTAQAEILYSHNVAH